MSVTSVILGLSASRMLLLIRAVLTMREEEAMKAEEELRHTWAKKCSPDCARVKVKELTTAL